MDFSQLTNVRTLNFAANLGVIVIVFFLFVTLVCLFLIKGRKNISSRCLSLIHPALFDSEDSVE
jgi:hypothetical protein